MNKVGKSSEIVVSKGSNTKVSGVGDVSFTMGWVEPKSKNKGTKKSKEKGEGVLIGGKERYKWTGSQQRDEKRLLD